MDKNSYGGLFVVFDGPNGVGKSTLIECVEKSLIDQGVDVYTTKEPSNAPIGRFTREISETVDKASLACLVAADRYNHIDAEIKMQLMKNRVVISDRYLLSSLILQQMDDVDEEFILAVNSRILLPDLQFAVTAEEETIEARLKERTTRTRFEQNGCVAKELKFLSSGVKALQKIGINVEWIDNTTQLYENVEFVTCRILEIIK